MGYIYKRIQEYCTWDEMDKINDILTAYGVDAKDDTTYLGEGSYKEVHRTNIKGVVLVITRSPKQLEEEMFILDLLRAYDYPVMEYYCSETVGKVHLLLGKALQAPTAAWTQDECQELEKKVENLLHKMVEDQIWCGDLQFLVDENDNPVFNDPLNISDHSGEYREAMCKHNKASVTYVEINKDKQWG